MPIKLVVGLGNPGKKYEGTRHNIGRELVESLRSTPLRTSWLVTEKFMNESGIDVSQEARYRHVAPEEILIILDEFQIPLRKVSILKKGSDGGHNGLKSVLESLGTENVPRMRIGIGPLPERQDPADFVLERFSAAERKQVDEVFPQWQEAVATLLGQGIDTAMNKFNNRSL